MHERTFAKWLAENAASSRTATTWTDRRGRGVVQFGSLVDAREGYAWPFSVRTPPFTGKGRTFEDSDRWWTTVSGSLRAAVATGDTEGAHLAARAILEWGGASTKNLTWLDARRSVLPVLFADAAHALALGASDESIPNDIRFNAGFSKIYAALVEDLVIYDSRVAAALAHLAVRAWGTIDDVPTSMRFPTSEGRTKALRSLRSAGWPRLQSGRQHALTAKRASRVLREARRFLDAAGGHPMLESNRDLEAALFMYGYDLSAHAEVPRERSRTGSPPTLPVRPTPRAYRLVTHGRRARRFNVDESDDGIVIENEVGRRDAFTWGEVSEVLRGLSGAFSGQPVPLANNVEKLGGGSERPGLGVTILALPGADVTKAQAASYLGPLLAELGLFDWNGRKVGIAWTLATEDVGEFAPGAVRERFREWGRADGSAEGGR